MSDHMKEVPPAAVLLGCEVISVDAKSGEVQLRFLADRQFANRHGTVQGGMLAAMLDSATGNAVMAFAGSASKFWRGTFWPTR